MKFSCMVETHGQTHFSGDALRLRQVIGNLVSNAVKFTGEGEVKLELEARPRDSTPDWLLVVKVTDTGPGMDSAHINDVFRPFVQADDSMSRQHGGTGLGLSIAYDIARAMNGDIEVKSKLGEGSVFTFTCPLQTIEQPLGEPSEQSDGLDTQASAEADRRPFILVAEDHPVNRRMLEIMLESLEVDVAFAEDGNAAVQACRESRFDLVLMDIQMPGLSGVEALQRIHEEERAAGEVLTPMIALTANAMTHQVKSYLEAGFDGFLAKPFSIEELIEAINKVLFTPAE